ncbi:MAG: hypothetical protein H8E62_11525 [Planctomycetes bacterium]|nr:hypothetical protein [Planctomycetota bacterium]
MKPADSIKNLFENSNITVGHEVDNKILNKATSALPQQARQTDRNIWSIMMHNRMTKSIAAAIIIIAALTITYHFTGSIDGASIAFADVIEAMKDVSWMHQTSKGFEGNITGTAEQWIGFESKIHAGKWANGKASFWDINGHRRYEYDPEKGNITIDYTRENDFPLNLSSPTILLESMHKMFIEQGAEIITKSAKYDGQTVQLQEISLSLEGQTSHSQSLRLYIQPRTKLLLAAHATGKDIDGNVIMDGEINFSYPQAGPADIYALGVPQDAPIISNLPDNDYLATWEQYQHNREIALNNYIAIITHEDQSLNGAVTMIDIDYKSNRKHRLERHSVFNTGEIFDEFWPEYKKQLGDSFESLLKWTQNHYDTNGSISIYLYDGGYNVSARRNNGRWSDLRKHYSPDWASFPNITLGDVAWPSTYGKTGKIIEDDFSKEHNYICVERLQPGSIHNEMVSPPGRFLYYLDSAKNYMCIRYVIEWNPEAEWQEDKHWLDGIPSEKIRDGSMTVTDITETVLAENGIWYPKTIVEQQTGICKDYKDKPLKPTYFRKIYIHTNPEFPDYIFDIKSLPK